MSYVIFHVVFLLPTIWNKQMECIRLHEESRFRSELTLYLHFMSTPDTHNIKCYSRYRMQQFVHNLTNIIWSANL